MTADAQPHVIATAGHVDHGKSSLILRLTGMDPDRLEEEKRRGLTIDLGFAWATLPSGREVGFVDVPGHERFVRNMLAGVGPVRLVLFVVAADEGWKPQSEEHLAIIDVLGAQGAVVALTKRDLVDAETLEIAELETRERLVGTVLEGAPVVACSSTTGEGLDDLRDALDALVAGAPAPDGEGRPRQYVDRIFSIRGSGTVVTGTLTGGPLAVGEEVELYPTGRRARIRGLQTHKRSIEIARPVSRVAANLVGVEREGLDRGDVMGRPGQWRATRLIEARVRAVRGLGHALTGRGAYKLYAGAAEREARIRLYGPRELRDPAGAFARLALSAPLVLDVHDRFVLREAGRRETVAGGLVLDIDPPLRPGADPFRRLGAREHAARGELPSILVRERGAVRAGDVAVLTGLSPSHIDGALRSEAWWISEEVVEGVSTALAGELAAFHGEHPLEEGAEVAEVRSMVTSRLERLGAPSDPALVEALLEELAGRGELERLGSLIRLPSHRVSLEARTEEVEDLVARIAAMEPTPPTVTELVHAGFGRDLVDAAGRAGSLVRISADIVLTSAFVERAERILRETATRGVTVSAFRERLATSRKYAVPLLEWFDERGVTVRRGDVRVLRSTDPTRAG